MAIEHEELRLSVTLDDQASAQLGNLQAALNNIGSAANPAQQGLNQLAQSLKGAGGHAQQLHGSLAGMAAKGGFIGGAFFEMGRQVEDMGKKLLNAVTNVREYADAMVRLEQASSRASTSAAQFQRNVAVFRESGVSAADAAKNIQGYADALGDLQMEQSKVRQNLFAGLRGAEFEDMRQLLRRVQTADKETAIAEIKKFGEDIRAYWTSQGQAERGAAAQRAFYTQLGMPDLDKLREPLEKITPQLERMYALRMANAEKFQTAYERTADASDRGVRSVQASAFYLLPIAETMEGIGGIVESVAHWFESWEESISDTNDALDSSGGFWEDFAKRLGLQGTRTRRDEIGPAGPAQGPQLPPGSTGGPRTWRPGMRTQLLGDGGGLGGDTGLGVGLGVGGAVDRLPEEYEEIGGRMIEDRRGENATFPGRAGDPVEDNTTEMEALANELRRLNDFLAPTNIMNPAFHNAPRGGSRGESNPEKPPKGMKQPGGGAAAEAVEARPITGQTPVARAMSEAMRYLEKNESKDAAVLKEYLKTNNRNLTGDQNAWCARFVDAIQTRAGRASLESSLPEGQKSGQKDDKTWSSLAYKNWGRGVTPDEDIKEGDVFVKERKGGGHVGVATGNYRINAKGEKEYEMLSGNIGGGKKGGGEVNTTYETIGGRGGKTTAGAGHGGVIAVRRGEETTAVADSSPEEGGGKGKRLDPSAPPGSEFALGDNAAKALLPQQNNISFEPDELAKGGKRSVQQQAQDALTDVRRSLSEQEEGRDPRRVQRALEGVAPDSDEEWELRRQRALKEAGPGYSEREEAQPPEGYGPGVGLPDPGEIEGIIKRGGGRSGKTEEDARKSEEYYSQPDWMKRGDQLGIEQRASLGRSGGPGSEMPPGSEIPAIVLAKRDAARNERAQGAAGDWLGEAAGRREQEDRISKLDSSVLDSDDRISVDTSGLFSVNVDAPAGTTVKAEGSGVLGKSEVNRSMPAREEEEVDA